MNQDNDIETNQENIVGEVNTEPVMQPVEEVSTEPVQPVGEVNPVVQEPINNQLVSPQPPMIDGNKKSSKNLIFILIPIVLVLIIIIVFVFLLGGSKKASGEDDTLETYNNIVIKNNDKKYAIFTSSGKKLTDFEFTYVSDFNNDVAYVENEKSQYALINSNGKYVIDFGKYDYITSSGYLYKAHDKDHNYYLLNYKGKVIYELGKYEKIKVRTYLVIDGLIVVDDGKKLDLLNYKGESLVKLDKVSGEDEVKVYEGDRDSVMVTAYYNGTTYVIDCIKGKIVNELSSKTPYCITSLSNLDRTRYVIRDCKDTDDAYKYYEGKKLKFATEKCKNLFFESDNENLICAEDYKRYLMSNDGKKGIEVYVSDNEYMTFDTYVKSEDRKGSVFYVDGKEKNTVECTTPSYPASRTEQIYVLKNSCKSKDSYAYYDVKGNKLIDKDFYRASSFNKEGVAIVSDDGEKYYLMNIKGKKISDDYEYIDFSNPSKTEIYRTRNGKTNYLLNTDGKVLIKTTGKVEEYHNYFTVEEKNVVTYYTLEGKEIYKVK